MDIAGYEIKRSIGQGGMATAFLAEQTSLGRQVVLKILDTSINDSLQTLQRFLNEGRLVASLHHPHIITIYDIGTAGSSVYISMEYVEGGDLKDRLQNGPLSSAAALGILEQIGSGLALAHAHGIVHRDVKPGNILFRLDGTPLLSDFGIAKSLAMDAELTSTGVFLGSPNYMAPEQAQAANIDGRADIYSLGVIVYEMLTGQKPYQSNSVIDVIYMHRQAPLPRLPAQLSSLQEFLDLMLAKDREDRFRDVPAMLHYLAMLKRSGAYAASTGAAEAPPHGEDAPNSRTATRVSWTRPEGPRSRLRRGLLLVLGFCAAGYAALLLLERRLEAPARASDPGSVADLATVPALGRGVSAGASPNTATVTDALLWLGRHSLDENRLTAPPKDNAYYYFSRLLHLDPDNVQARRGLDQIAAQYAILAEREIASGDPQRARSYISLGQQIDPRNEALAILEDIAEPAPKGLFETLAGWFK